MLNLLTVAAETFEDIDYEVNPQDLENAIEGSAAASGFLAAFGIFMAVFVIIAIILGIFSLWMLIDSILRKDEEYPEGSGTKVLWILLIIFLSPVTSIIYFFLVKKKIKRGNGGNVPPAPTNTPQPPTQEPPQAPKA